MKAQPHKKSYLDAIIGTSGVSLLAASGIYFWVKSEIYAAKEDMKNITDSDVLAKMDKRVQYLEKLKIVIGLGIAAFAGGLFGGILVTSLQNLLMKKRQPQKEQTIFCVGLNETESRYLLRKGFSKVLNSLGSF